MGAFGCLLAYYLQMLEPNSFSYYGNYGAEPSIESSSRVLLVCVYDTIVFQITNDLIYSRFQDFGTILRLLIFEKKEVTKLFIEFSTHEEAALARESLDGKKLCNNICKMSIYFSTFNNVDLKHQTSEGIDFYTRSPSSPDQTYSEYVDSCSVSSSPNKSLSRANKTQDESSNPFMQRSKTDQQNLAWHINKARRDDIWGFPLDISSQIESDIDSLLNEEFDEERSDKWSSASPQSPSRLPKVKNPEHSDSTTVVGFSYKQPLRIGQIYNLFSNFGNVSQIMLTKKEVRVKFRNSEFAAISLNYLKSFSLGGNKIELVSMPFTSCEPKEGQYSEIMCFDESTDRFTLNKSITINAPSKTLHVSGMKKDFCTSGGLTKMFSSVCYPSNVKVLKQSIEKNMALVEFRSLEESFKVISECHNMVVAGRKIQISFTKSQI